jgi:hypothetical protein
MDDEKDSTIEVEDQNTTEAEGGDNANQGAPNDTAPGGDVIIIK